MSAAVQAVLALIQQLLPLVSGTQTAQIAGVVANIINTLMQFMPLIQKEVSAVYTTVKGIVTALRGVTSVPEQLADLDAFEAGIDAAWDAVVNQLDPDAAQGAAAKS